MDEAEAAAIEVAFELNKEPPDLSLVLGKRGSERASDTPSGRYVAARVTARKPRSIPITKAIQNSLPLEYEKAEAELLSRVRVDTKKIVCRRHLIP